MSEAWALRLLPRRVPQSQELHAGQGGRQHQGALSHLVFSRRARSPAGWRLTRQARVHLQLLCSAVCERLSRGP